MPNLRANDHIELVEGWGMSRKALAYVHRPSTIAQIQTILISAQEQSLTIAARGAGCSYGDAFLNHDQIVLDLSRMNLILAWNPETGRIELEPGVTIGNIWRYCIEDGWWPPVVPGTMHVTIGGGAGMNFHGKNNYKIGPIGDHIVEFDILLPSGKIKTCNRESDPDLFHAAVGGFGMLGIFTRIVLQMKKVYSGLLKVDAFATHDIGHMIEEFDIRRHNSDYMVGWIDCFSSSGNLGRGLVHTANYLNPGDDPEPAQTLRVSNQELPDTLMGVLPKSIMGRLLQPFTNNLGMNAINQAKFLQGATLGNHKTILQPHAQFAFLLDYVPNWKHAYKPGALVQFQSFIPEAAAEKVFNYQLKFCQKMGIVPYLGVFKRHRADDFLMTHSVNGYSLALDFPLTASNQDGLDLVIEQLSRNVVDHGGRFYFAKDSLLRSDIALQALGGERIHKFLSFKRQNDPSNILQSDLFRRIFPQYCDRSCPSNSH